MLLEQLREDIVFYGRQMLKYGLTMHTGGNLSARDKESGLIVIKPTNIPYDRLEPEQVPVLDENGKIIEGKYAPSSEWPMHTMIFRTYPRVKGVVHCHSIYATACSVAGCEIPLINHEISVFCSSNVRIAPFEIPGSIELAKSAIKGFGDDNCVTLLQNHGPIAMGATLWHAFDAACAAEQAAATFYITKMLGNVVPVPEAGRAILRADDPLTDPNSDDTFIKSV